MSLFGWATSGFHDEADTYNTNYHPYSTSNSYVNTGFNTYGYGPSSTMTDENLVGTSANYDWGVYNNIMADGTEIAAGTYRTLTNDEWVFLFNNRTDAFNKRGLGKVNGVMGLILLPDDWTLPDGLEFFPVPSIYAPYTQYTADNWTQMEANGAVFLPQAGTRNVTSLSNVGSKASYWSSTCDNGGYARYPFINNGIGTQYSGERHLGLCVRLVHNAE